MKKTLVLVLILTLFFSCKEPTNNEQSNIDHYSTKVDTTYSQFDRTKIDQINRTIYSNNSETNYYHKTLELTTEFYDNNSRKKKILTFDIVKSTFSVKESKINKFEIITFKNENELTEFFAKVDSVKVDGKLEERKKVTHYDINKLKELILISKYNRGSELNKNSIVFSTDEYEGIKEAFNKYKQE